MAKKKFLKSKTNFTLRRLHQSGSYGNIYERDYTTVFNSPTDSSGQIAIYASPSFKLTVQSGLNRQKKYKYGKWLTNSSCGEETTLWTLNCLPEPNRVDSKIVLKPNTRRLTDFACYGSSFELIKTSLKEILFKFPAEMYVSNITLESFGIFENNPELKNEKIYRQYKDYFIVENPFKIDILQKVIPEDVTVSPLRFLCDSEYKYVVINEKNEIVANGRDFQEYNDNASTFKNFWETDLTEDKGCLKDGDILGEIKFYNLNGDGRITMALNIISLYYQNDIIYIAPQDYEGYHLRPHNDIINDFFNELNDFEKILLNQQTQYTAIFETYNESPVYGWQMEEIAYQWPTVDETKGGWNLSINSIPYSRYINSLTKLAIGYDTLFTDAIWKDMTHESISNMDLTIISNDEEVGNTSKMQQMLNIVGRQFDEIKKYADSIKNSTQITYNQDNNTPDYFLPDNLELAGWEPKEILNNIPNNIHTDPMYGAHTQGFTASDANNDFMRRLKLNSKEILSRKGTKRGIEDLMAVFGFHSTDWIKKYYKNINKPTDIWKKAFIAVEYVYVVNGYWGADETVFHENVEYINSLKDNYSTADIENNSFNPYQGLPVAEVSYGDKTRLVPWFDRNERYDTKLYFQMNGGWACNKGDNDKEIPTYDYTISKIQYIPTLEELYRIPPYALDKNGVYYVEDTEAYYRLKDISKNTEEAGWEMIVDEVEINKIENIIDNNKGNNPHTGNYDEGESYYLAFGNLFKNSNFNRVRADEIEGSTNYGLNIERQADSTKCLFFSDEIGPDYLEDDAALRGRNRIVPTNLFGGNSYDEVSSLSVMNSKELHITFDKTYREFLENDVIPYIKQIIPSTTIFSYSFEEITGDDDAIYEAHTHGVVCNGTTNCTIYAVI